MGIGANDHIDRLLVRKYADLKVDNHDMASSAVPPEKMYEIMNDIASSQRMMLNLRHKLQSVTNSIKNQQACKSYAR